MTQPKSHQKHPDPPLAKVAVFWDYESCRPAGFMPAYTIVDNIREACLPYGSITTFKAYVEKADAYLSEPASRPLHHGHPSLREQLQLYGVGLSYYSPSARSTMGERLLLVDMMLFALDNPAPSTVLILITAEELSPYAISALRLRHYKIVLITPQNNGNPLRPAMAAQANEVIDWAAVMSKGRRSPTESAGIGGASARSLSSPGSVSTVSSMQMSPTTHRITPSGTVSSGGTVVDQALVPRISPTLSRQSQTQPSQAPTSLTNPTPLFPSVISHNTFQPFRSSTFTPRTQSGLGRSWNPAFTGGSIFSPPPTQTHFRSGSSAGGRERGSGGGGERGGGQERGGATTISLNTNAPLSPTDHGPLSALSTSSSLASPTGSSNWTQSPPTTSTQLPNVGGSAGSGQGGHAFGPVGPSLSPTESIVRRPNQAPSSIPSSQSFPSVDNRSGLTTTTSSGANKSNIANTGGGGVGRGQTPPGLMTSFAPPQNFPVQTQQMPLPMHMPQPHQPIHTFPLNLPPHYNVPQPQHQPMLHHHHQQQPSQGGGGHHHHPSSQGLPHIPIQHFDLLINILNEFRNEGKSRPYRSKIGSELLQRDRMVYQRAGVNSFKDYVGYAEQIGLVRLGGHSGSPGKEWIELVVPPPFIGGGGPGVTSPGGHGHGGGPISMMGGGNPNLGNGGGNMDTGGGVGGVS